MKLGVFVVDFDVEFLLELGIEGLILPFETHEHILKEAEKDFEIFLEFRPFDGGVIENVFGRKTRIRSLGCASDEGLWKRNFSKLEDVEYEIILDFVRFPSPANGNFFYSCFCEKCHKKARDFGYNLRVIRENVKDYLKTDDLVLLEDWFHFRQNVINEYIDWSELRKAFFFTPSLSFLVGQRYDFNMKCICPMLYPETVGPACIGYELAYMTGTLKHVVLENLGSSGDEVIGTEFKKALKSKAKIEPIIMISDNILRRLEMVKKAKRVFIFAYSNDKKGLFAKIKEF
ncbi:hypothetical protein [Archaeoglobus neptunius]|uniref:hypothetical protein n=1 Tax=Archaeoglobus neptunius TaxID=2798580 RepID=UPI0019254AE3|nr:hypothetical protein [Archaeoglobus neptunius]